MMYNDRVFMVGWEYPPHNSGGLGVACQGLTTALAELNSQIYFSLPYSLPLSPAHMTLLDCSHPDWLLGKSGNVAVSPPFFAYDQTPVLITKKVRAMLNASDFSALPQSDLERQVTQYSSQVTNKAGAKKFDVVHAHDWMSFQAGMDIKQKTGRPLVTHVHSTEFDRSPQGGSQYIMKSEYEGLKFSDKVIAVSWYTKKILVDKYRIDENKIEVVHNGIDPVSNADPGQHHFAKKRPIVVFMGRLTGQKGPDHFLNLASALTSKMPEILFIVAGSGDMYQQLLFSTAAKGLTGKVLYAGFVRGKEKDVLLDRADVFIMPSLSEPFGLVAIEAAQRSTPVVISKTSGVAEVLPGSIQADFWDVDLMSSKIIELLSNKGFASAVVEQQNQQIKNVTWQSAAQKVKDIYRRAMLA